MCFPQLLNKLLSYYLKKSACLGLKNFVVAFSALDVVAEKDPF